MSDISANIVVQPFDINISMEDPALTITPQVIDLTVIAAGGTTGTAGGGVYQLQYNNGSGFGGIPTATYSNGNLALGNVANLQILGGTNGYVLQTDGTGNLSWTAQTGGGGGNGTPGGSNTQIQYNDGGSFGGNTGFTFNEISGNVNIPGNLIVVGTINGATANSNYANFAGQVTNSAQPNITSVGTLTSLTVTGNISGGNANLGNSATANYFIGSGNNLSNIQGSNVSGAVANATYAVSAGSANTAGTVTTNAQPNITSVGTLTSLVITGNLSSGNANLGNAARANFFIGSGNNLSNIQGANVSGIVANATHANTANTVTTNAQPNITSVGTLTSLTVSGTANIGNIRQTGSGNVIIGQFAAANSTPNANIIALGYSAASINQGANSIAIGILAGNSSSGIDSIAIGRQAGSTGSEDFSIAIGYQAGANNNSPNSIAIGSLAGTTTQKYEAIAIGREAASNNQSNGAIAIGTSAGSNNQGLNAVAIGVNSGSNTQGNNAIALGVNSGANQGNSSIALGASSGVTQGIESIALGASSGLNQSNYAIAIGRFAGRGITAAQGANAIAIGYNAGNIAQYADGIAIGQQAGNNTQGYSAIAIGPLSGSNNQANYAVALGTSAGTATQGDSAVAVGYLAATNSQGANATALGTQAGRINQGVDSIAIGRQAGYYGIGTNSIAIGTRAGYTANTVANNAIIINATGSDMAANTANALFVKPIRNATSSNVMYYDSTTGEITYNVAAFGAFYNPNDIAITANTVANLDLTNTYSANGVSIVSNNQITIARAGTYNIQMSLQLLNTDNASEHEFDVWFAKNGTDVVQSATQYTVIKNNGKNVVALNFVDTAAANDYYQIRYAASSANISLESFANISTPYVRPAIPSAIVTVVPVGA